jgi:hypothetical protein
MNEWIKINDERKRPPENESIIFLISNYRAIGVYSGSEYCVDYLIDNFDTIFNSYFDYHDWVQEKITHWMPLPNPPLAEE